MPDLAAEYLTSARKTFQKYREMAEGAMRQVDDDAFFAAPDGESNSIALVVKHLAGNMRSRWSGFLTTDGEKPDRDRDAEFEQHGGDSRESLMSAWTAAWDLALREFGALTADDLTRTVAIRGEPHTVVLALERQVTHAAYHVGQIVYLAKHHAGSAWQTLSVPKGKSREFNATMLANAGDGSKP
jgi:hypothetical protein